MYSGGKHGCVAVRSAIAKALAGDAETAAAARAVAARWPGPRRGGGPGQGGVPRQAEMHAAAFCPCPEGDSPSAKRQYDAVLAGCVPVLVSDDAVYAFEKLVGGPLDEADFALRVSEQDAIDGKLVGALRAVNASRLLSLRRNQATHAHWFRYYAPGTYAADPLPLRRYPDGGALALLAADLAARAAEAVSRSTKCALERATPHFDLTKQHCGAPDREKEVYRLGLAARSAKTPERRAAAARGIQAWKSGHVL